MGFYNCCVPGGPGCPTCDRYPVPRRNPYNICVPLYPCKGRCVPVQTCGPFCTPFATPGSCHCSSCDRVPMPRCNPYKLCYPLWPNYSC